MSLVCIRLEWLVDGGMEWVRRAHEHGCRRARHGVVRGPHRVAVCLCIIHGAWAATVQGVHECAFFV